MGDIKEEMILSITPAGDKDLEDIKRGYYEKYAEYIKECYKMVLWAEIHRVDGNGAYLDEIKREHTKEYEGTCKELKEAGKLTGTALDNRAICDKEFFRAFKEHITKLFNEVERNKYKKRVLDICGADIIKRYEELREKGEVDKKEGVVE